MKWIIAAMLLALPYPALAACSDYNMDQLQHALELAEETKLSVAIQAAQAQIDRAKKECGEDAEEGAPESAYRLQRSKASELQSMESQEEQPQPGCASKLTGSTISRHCN